MKTNNLRVRNVSGSLLAILFVACGLGACTTTEAKTDGGAGKGGSGGSGTGTGGAAGTTGGAGGAAGYMTSDGVLCPPPAASITDFTYVAPDAGTATDGGTDGAATAPGSVNFGGGANLGGGEFWYPTTGNWPVTSDVTGNNWHMTGTLGDYSGFGLYFDNCSHVDASAFSGISFTISGATLPPGGIITMGIGTLDNVIAASWLSTHGGTPTAGAPGRCIPANSTATTTQYSQTTCGDAQIPVTITNTPTTVSIKWTDFTTGKPEAQVHPSDITSIYWFLPPPTGAGTATPTTYPVDITIDDLAFTP